MNGGGDDRMRRRNERVEEESAHALVRRFNADPPGKLYCVHGDREVFRLSLQAASVSLLRGVPVALVDGTNRFDVYAVADFARRVAARSTAVPPLAPSDLLERVFISRAFTCYQMEAVITERLPRFLAREKIPVAVVFGLLDTFYDEQAPLFEVKASLRRIMEALRRLRHDHVGVLLASEDAAPASPERRALFPRLAAGMDGVFQMTGQLSGRKNEPQRHRDAGDEYGHGAHHRLLHRDSPGPGTGSSGIGLRRVSLP